MWVYGDRIAERDAGELVDELIRSLDQLAMFPAGIARHREVVSSFIAAAELVQALADVPFVIRGLDVARPDVDRAMAMTVALARCVMRSWDSGFSCDLPMPRLRDAAIELRRYGGPVRVKRGEGYAYYALYPEAYALAARRAANVAPGPRRVIGIRSIGTGLAAMVAAVHHAPPPPTLRPFGDPYARKVETTIPLADPAATRHAIVDEGPGQSGSSFGAVVDRLRSEGVPEDRIECYPSHANALGPAASVDTRERWARLHKYTASSEQVVTRLSQWLTEAFGPVKLDDYSAGAWRAARYRTAAEWPASVVHQERRKFHVRAEQGPLFARYIGLGSPARAAYERAIRLAWGGYIPEPLALVHGFLVEKWCAGAPLDPDACDREALLARLVRYLVERARVAAPCGGASPRTLLAMAKRNTGLALGNEAATALSRWDRTAEHLRPRACWIDGRLNAWKWLHGPAGLVKTDAHDHHDGHDLIGCQDIAWDVVGATTELGLDRDLELRLIVQLRVDPALVAFYRACYLAFHLGRVTLGATSCEPAEAARLAVAADRYKNLLRSELARPR